MAIKKFQDLQVEHPQRYEVTDNAGTENLKTIKFSPGKVYQEGTKETAVIFNNIQKNGLYTVIGTRVIEGTEEIYDVELEGLEEFGIFDINLQLVANSKNTTNSPKLRILNEKYSFVNNYGTISIGDLAVNNIYIVKIDTVKKTAFLTESDKLQKGTYPGKASDLKTEIDGKLDKGGYGGDAKSLSDGIVELEKNKLPKGNLPVYLENAETIIKMLQGNSGLEFDNNILYIQQSGTKTQNKYYFDINTGRMYRCLNTTTTVINTPNLFIDESNRGIIEIIDAFFKQKVILDNITTYPINTRTIENFSTYKFVIVQVNDFLEPQNNTIFTIPVFTIALGKPIFLPANGYRTTASNIANFINFTSYTTVEIGETGGGAGQDTITLYYM